MENRDKSGVLFKNDRKESEKHPEYKQAAEACIEIYNWLKDTDPNGRIWESN